MSRYTNTIGDWAAMTSSNNTVSYEEVQSTRTESKFIFKWTVSGLNCTTTKDDENLPAAKFSCKLNSGLRLEGELTISGKECYYRVLNFSLKSFNEQWKVICHMWLNDDIANKETWNFNEKKTSVEKELHRKKCLLEGDLNIINCEIVHVVYKQTRRHNVLEDKEFSLPTALEKLFKNKKLCDVTFDVGGVEVVAHKCLLVQRSKAFAKLLELCDTESTQPKPIIIEDIEPAVFTEILHYIYTDKAPNLYQMPSRLLIASDQYGLENLKRMCEKELANKITIETAADILILADVNKAPHLKDYTMGFIKGHSRAVADTQGWINIIKNHNHLLAELYSNIIE